PTTIEVSSEARKRASTISGLPGKATAVDTSTTGLIAGAPSMKANAAARARRGDPVAPPPSRDRDRGTLTTRQGDAGQTGRGHRQRVLSGQGPGQPARGGEGGDRARGG